MKQACMNSAGVNKYRHCHLVNAAKALVIRMGDYFKDKFIIDGDKSVNRVIDYKKFSNGDRITRQFLTKVVKNTFKEDYFISTTGLSSRQLSVDHDDANNFYMQGSMGYAAAIALGLVLRKNLQRKVVALDGDGALIMRLGVLTTIGNLQPEKFLHIVANNHSYASTGGQKTASSNSDFAKIAGECGYRHVYHAEG